MPHFRGTSSVHSTDMSSCLTVLLAGGKGSRLEEMTENDSKPALRFGDRARIVDFAIGNARNSGLHHILAATQYKPQSLHRRLSNFWQPIFAECNGQIDICYGPDVTGREKGYEGTAAAVTANIERIDAAAPEHVIVLAADHVYRMDYREMFKTHLNAGADLTVAADTAPLEQASAFGIIHANGEGRIRDFLEKPDNPPAMADNPNRAFVSMGVYIFRWSALRRVLLNDARNAASAHDFGFDIVPQFVKAGTAVVHRLASPVPFLDPYWRDVGTLDAYFEAHLDFVRAQDPQQEAQEIWPILPRSVGGVLSHTHTNDGNGPIGVTNSYIGSHTVVGRGTRINRALVMQGAVVGAECRINGAILAPGVVLEPGTVIGRDAEEDAQWFRRTNEGTVLVTPAMLAYRRREEERFAIRAPRKRASWLEKSTSAGRSADLAPNHS